MDVGKLQRLYEVGGENPITGEKEVQRCVWEEAARRHQTVPEPTFTFSAEQDYDPKPTKYLKLIIDPDAPGPDGTIQAPLQGVLSDFFHLAIEDAQPDCVTQSPRQYECLNPTPLSVAPHRYIFLVCRQPKNLSRHSLCLWPLLVSTYSSLLTSMILELVGGNFYLQGAGTNVGGIGVGGLI
ncbi:hypothetical protein BKA61DRAFT_727800, partial [Leptodontidium sp. MPI-SDFR-AT-0119]